MLESGEYATVMQTNKTVITVIITTLAIAALCCVSTTCMLSYFGIEIPPELNTLTAALVGALSAMLVKTSPSEATPAATVNGEPKLNGPIPVTVENTQSEPVPVEQK